MSRKMVMGDYLFKRFKSMCGKLNLCTDCINRSWTTFENTRKTFTLEGDPLHWLCCSLYVTCRTEAVESRTSNADKGWYVDLTFLLKECNLSLSQFFFNIKRWCDMSSVSSDVCKNIEDLEKCFTVTYNIFQQYHPIFFKIFQPAIKHDFETGFPKNRNEPVQVTTAKLFEFCWLLFLVNKSLDSIYTSNLVNSCHLMMAVCDWIWQQAYAHIGTGNDLLNVDFKDKVLDSEEVVSQQAPCIVRHLCPSDKMYTDVLYIKHYPLKHFIRNLFHAEFLHETNEESGILHSGVFGKNFRGLNALYETQMKKIGCCDERTFIAEYRRTLDQDEQQKINNQENTNINTTSGAPSETGKDIKAEQKITKKQKLEISDFPTGLSANETNTKLYALLSGCQAGPSSTLTDILAPNSTKILEKIDDIVQKFSPMYIKAFRSLTTNQTAQIVEQAKKRVHFATVLFYKLIDNILQNEKVINTDIAMITDKNLFYECTFVCSLEIIQYSSYGSAQAFPWILDVLQIEPYHFVKIIELIIRSRDELSRDIVRHLNQIEAMTLTSLVWKSNSVIWETLLLTEQRIPKCEETLLPEHLDPKSMLVNKLNQDQKEHILPTVTPVTATDCFASPPPQLNVITERTLFGHPILPLIQAPSTVLQKHTHILIRDQNGITKLIPLMDINDQSKAIQSNNNNNNNSNSTVQIVNPPSSNQATDNEDSSKTVMKPKRTGSLSILFRKLYNLAAERIDRFCTSLNLIEFNVKQKIWTVFEESIRNHIVLLKDRDLDQLIMCAVYVICKISEPPNQRSFTDIMKSYREQPQATSDTYRNVLLKSTTTLSVDSVWGGNEGGTTAPTAASTAIVEERGDLIKFYNTIYVQEMKSFAVKFATNTGNSTGTTNSPHPEVLLSPLPNVRRQYNSPSVLVGDNIVIKPLDQNTMVGSTGGTTGKNYSYIFSRSPSKDLKNINRAIRTNGMVLGKRQLHLSTENENELQSSKRVARKVHSLIEERKQNN